MKFKLNAAGGQFELEGDLKSIIEQASLIQSIPSKCPLCQGEIKLSFRKPKGYTYYSLKCTKCGATKNFGITKEDDSLFLRWDEKFEKYEPKSEPKADTQQQGVDNVGQEVPF